MKAISVKNRGPKQLTAMLVGDSRSGKTHFAATWPRPIFLMDASEHGWTTLQYMEPDEWYEPGHEPYAIAIEEPKDLVACLVALRQQSEGAKVDLESWPVPTGKNEIGTVVIDSLTFYADAYFSKLEVEAAGNGKVVDTRSCYGDLHSHLRFLMIQVHKLPYHVIWTALPKEIEGALNGALVAGQTATKAPARCDLWLLCNKNEQRSGKKVTVDYEIHTENYRGMKAGHRFGKMLDPIMGAHFEAFEAALQLEPWTNRLSAGKKKNAKKAAKATTRAAAQ